MFFVELKLDEAVALPFHAFFSNFCAFVGQRLDEQVLESLIDCIDLDLSDVDIFVVFFELLGKQFYFVHIVFDHDLLIFIEQ